jgi:hypothetical protein
LTPAEYSKRLTRVACRGGSVECSVNMIYAERL